MKTVGDMMHIGASMPLLPDTATMQDVLLAMTSKGFGIAVLTHDGILSSVITDGDLRRNMERLMQCSPAEIANAHPITVTPDCFAAEALALLNERKVSALLVIDEQRRPVGVLHIHDFLRAGVM
jgi:arabinose-5-phosphate isomerase